MTDNTTPQAKRQLKAFFSKYKKLEDRNDHNGAAILLAQTFGTEDQLETLKGIQKKHNELGYMTGELMDLRREISSPLWEKFVEARNKQGIF